MDKVHVVLQVLGGVPETPEVFANGPVADARYFELAEKMFNIDTEGMRLPEVGELVRNLSHPDDLCIYELEVKK